MAKDADKQHKKQAKQARKAAKRAARDDAAAAASRPGPIRRSVPSVLIVAAGAAVAAAVTGLARLRR
jgi:hypothetical protein